MSEAIVVGSGPNGLAGAAELARSGVKVTVLEAAETIGGGTRTSDVTGAGVLSDHCSAVHPMAVASPFLRSLDLERHGFEWRWPEVDLGHPLDDGSAGVMKMDIEATAAGLGEDGAAWKRVFGPSSRSFPGLVEDIMQPLVGIPGHPIALTRFGIPSALPATILSRRWNTPQARALFGGVAAHAFSPLNGVLSSSLGMALLCAGHAFGWAVAKGGSRSITDLFAAVVTENGGAIETGRRVTSLNDLPKADIVLLDLAPQGVVDVAGSRLPARVARAYRRFKHGPGSFKLDMAVEGGVPWTNESCRSAGTVHCIGPFEELAAAEADINRGEMPERPFVLVGQQYLADPTRSNGNVHPVWAYAHVPSGYTGDATEAILGQIERFAPGVRERIVARSVRTPSDFAEYNANYIGGDIITGAATPWQIAVRPRLALDPYATGIPGVYICSAATPPGAGAHGMNGYNAARSAMKRLR